MSTDILLMRRPALLLAGILVVVGVTPVSADPFLPRINETRSYKDVLFGLQEARENIETVECGGWSEGSDGLTNSNGGAGELPVPSVSPDVPGRPNQSPLGNATKGVGVRTPFQFPDSAFGFSSACDILNLDEITDPDLQKRGIPGIRWEWSQNPDDDVQFFPMPESPGVIHINPYHWCRPPSTATPRLCEKLQKTLERLSAVAPRIADDAFCPMPTDGLPVVGYPELISKRYCFDPPYTFDCHGSSGGAPAPVNTTKPDSPSQPTTCRTPWKPDFSNKMQECHDELRVGFDGSQYRQIVVDVGGYQNATASSYFRHYGGEFSDWRQTQDPGHSTLSVTAPDDQKWKLRAECYGLYANPEAQREDDPKEIVMGRGSQQCEVVILSDTEASPKSPQWKDGNSGKQKDKVAPDPARTEEAPRVDRTSAVPSPWVADTESNLSIVDIGKLRDLQRSLDDPADITGMMGAILPVHLRASKTVAPFARSDTFNDDGERAFAQFWEAQQKEILTMTADPAVRLIMPARFLLGLADDDPLFQYVQNIVSRSDGVVAATLRSGSEDVMNVLLSLLRVYVAPIRTVRIPVLVPLASENEITSLIFEWQEWQKDENLYARVGNRDSNASLADPIIDKLIGYIERLHEARRLRSAEAAYLARLFDVQREIRTYAADWYDRNGRILLQTAERGVQRRELKQVARSAQTLMLETDESQLLYCSNQRYSLPIFSLLDLPEPWWGNRDPGDTRESSFLPPDLRELQYQQPHDIEYDFSEMKFSREPLLIPELQFISSEIKLPTPPLAGAIPIDPTLVPELPPLPGVDLFDRLTIPSVQLPGATTIDVPPPHPDLSEAIRRMQDFVERMEKMKNAYSVFQPSFLIPPDPEQLRGNTAKMIHVENDLQERIARAFSRWLPIRKADADGRKERLVSEGFQAGTRTCHEGVVCVFLPTEDSLAISWQWFVPTSGGDELTRLADDVRSATVPGGSLPEDQNPFTATIPVLRRLFPDLPVPITIDLTIPR